MRLLAGTGLPGVRPADLAFATNQVRIRLPRDPARVWPLTQAIVARLRVEVPTATPDGPAK